MTTSLFVAYDHYVLAAIALVGTFAAALALWAATRHWRHATWVNSLRGLSPPFVNVIGVLFALTLAFLGNDTWNAHDRAATAIQHEAGALGSILALTEALPAPEHARIDALVRAYAKAAANEWTALAARDTDPATAQAMAALVSALAQPALAAHLAPSAAAEALRQAMLARDARETRAALSRTHVNPLKWLGMAFLGLLTMIAIAMVYVDQPRAELLAVVLFATAAAPTAAIVLIQGNPFQPPGAVSSAPLAALGLSQSR